MQQENDQCYFNILCKLFVFYVINFTLNQTLYVICDSLLYDERRLRLLSALQDVLAHLGRLQVRPLLDEKASFETRVGAARISR